MKKISVSIAYAEKNQQWLKELLVDRGTLANELVIQSKLMLEVPALANANLEELKLGVYSKPVDNDYLLEEGDRLEIYRPLKADPKEVRRQLALMGKTMGSNPKT